MPEVLPCDNAMSSIPLNSPTTAYFSQGGVALPVISGSASGASGSNFTHPRASGSNLFYTAMQGMALQRATSDQSQLASSQHQSQSQGPVHFQQLAHHPLSMIEGQQAITLDKSGPVGNVLHEIPAPLTPRGFPPSIDPPCPSQDISAAAILASLHHGIAAAAAANTTETTDSSFHSTASSVTASLPFLQTTVPTSSASSTPRNAISPSHATLTPNNQNDVGYSFRPVNHLRASAPQAFFKTVPVTSSSHHLSSHSNNSSTLVPNSGLNSQSGLASLNNAVTSSGSDSNRSTFRSSVQSSIPSSQSLHIEVQGRNTEDETISTTTLATNHGTEDDHHFPAPPSVRVHDGNDPSDEEFF